MKKQGKKKPEKLALKGFRESDLIIEYMMNTSKRKKLPAILVKNYERYHLIHSMLLEYKQDQAIITTLVDFHGRTVKQARFDITEARYVFGKSVKIDYDYEKYWSLQVAKRNIEIAIGLKNSTLLTKALEVHDKILGKRVDNSDVPDFSDFEPNTYNIVLPKEMDQERLMEIASLGAVNLIEGVPASRFKVNTKGIPQAKEE